MASKDTPSGLVDKLKQQDVDLDARLANFNEEKNAAVAASRWRKSKDTVPNLAFRCNYFASCDKIHFWGTTTYIGSNIYDYNNKYSHIIVQ